MTHDYTNDSLSELTKLCARYLDTPRNGDASACQELLNRACLTQNDRAWDALVMLLRPYLLKLIFEQHSHLTPKEAENRLYSALQRLRSHILRHPPAKAPSLQNILVLFKDLYG